MPLSQCYEITAAVKILDPSNHSKKRVSPFIPPFGGLFLPFPDTCSSFRLKLIDRNHPIYYLLQPSFYCFIGSFQPRGIRAAATFPTPRSVASRLNWAAAFLVSCTSIRIPSELICFRVCGEIGCIEVPNPSINRSVFQPPQ